jgi:hypothetical protein
MTDPSPVPSVSKLDAVARVTEQALALTYELVDSASTGEGVPDDSRAGAAPRSLSGAPAIDDRLVDAMLDITDRLAALPTNRRSVSGLDLYLERTGSGFWPHESLARYDGRNPPALRDL